VWCIQRAYVPPSCAQAPGRSTGTATPGLAPDGGSGSLNSSSVAMARADISRASPEASQKRPGLLRLGWPWGGLSFCGWGGGSMAGLPIQFLINARWKAGLRGGAGEALAGVCGLSGWVARTSGRSHSALWPGSGHMRGPGSPQVHPRRLNFPSLSLPSLQATAASLPRFWRTKAD